MQSQLEEKDAKIAELQETVEELQFYRDEWQDLKKQLAKAKALSKDYLAQLYRAREENENVKIKLQSKIDDAKAQSKSAWD